MAEVNSLAKEVQDLPLGSVLIAPLIYCCATRIKQLARCFIDFFLFFATKLTGPFVEFRIIQGDAVVAK